MQCGAGWKRLIPRWIRFGLLREIRSAQQRLVEIADCTAVGDAAAPDAPTLEQFLSGLRTAWQAARCVRPRGRRRKPSGGGVVPTRS